MSDCPPTSPNSSSTALVRPTEASPGLQNALLPLRSPSVPKTPARAATFPLQSSALEPTAALKEGYPQLSERESIFATNYLPPDFGSYLSKESLTPPRSRHDTIYRERQEPLKPELTLPFRLPPAALDLASRPQPKTHTLSPTALGSSHVIVDSLRNGSLGGLTSPLYQPREFFNLHARDRGGSLERTRGERRVHVLPPFISPV